MVDARRDAFKPGRTPGDARFRRWFAGPPGWTLGGLAAGNAVVSLWTYSVPGGYLVPLPATTAVWACLLLAVGIKALMQPVFGVPGGRPGWHSWARWGAVLGTVAAAWALVQTGVPVRAGTAWAEPAVAAYAADSRSAQTPERFGPYRVQSAGNLGDQEGARFLVEGAGFLDDTGFAYSPGGPPPDSVHGEYAHLHGPWYSWTREL
ncbi:hypothetical protein [Streptomonospora salina]|uniref:Uncharacterized protein n=1 Tax=Streptomonospora salina TaxID=104205 RepID=A0A841EAZ0_9ACTN|nr:hypothetical protein [Streptomonospora salina]MBB5996631.1 hypothetical protein [Streptomonospora salina]